MIVHDLSLPLQPTDILKLNIGDKVLLSGTVYTARDAAHKRIFELIVNGKKSPFDLSTSAIFYCGPSPTPQGKVCGAIGPTTSARMDKWTPLLLGLGLKVMIGKGERSQLVTDSIIAHKALYLVSIGGASALLASTVVSCETFLWEELGTEAIHKLEVVSFPAYVAIC